VLGGQQSESALQNGNEEVKSFFFLTDCLYKIQSIAALETSPVMPQNAQLLRVK